MIDQEDATVVAAPFMPIHMVVYRSICNWQRYFQLVGCVQN